MCGLFMGAMPQKHKVFISFYHRDDQRYKGFIDKFLSSNIISCAGDCDIIELDTNRRLRNWHGDNIILRFYVTYKLFFGSLTACAVPPVMHLLWNMQGLGE